MRCLRVGDLVRTKSYHSCYEYGTGTITKVKERRFHLDLELKFKNGNKTSITSDNVIIVELKDTWRKPNEKDNQDTDTKAV